MYVTGILTPPTITPVKTEHFIIAYYDSGVIRAHPTEKLNIVFNNWHIKTTERQKTVRWFLCSFYAF